MSASSSATTIRHHRCRHSTVDWPATQGRHVPDGACRQGAKDGIATGSGAAMTAAATAFRARRSTPRRTDAGRGAGASRLTCDHQAVCLGTASVLAAELDRQGRLRDPVGVPQSPPGTWACAVSSNRPLGPIGRWRPIGRSTHCSGQCGAYVADVCARRREADVPGRGPSACCWVGWAATPARPASA